MSTPSGYPGPGNDPYGTPSQPDPVGTNPYQPTGGYPPAGQYPSQPYGAPAYPPAGAYGAAPAARPGMSVVTTGIPVDSASCRRDSVARAFNTPPPT